MTISNSHSGDALAERPHADTIEMELSTADVLLLAQRDASTQPETRPEPLAVRRRWRAGYIAGAFVVTTAAVALASGALRTKQDAPIQTPVAHTIAPPRPAQPAVPTGEPVRFKNPFDRNEVFEFPAGTSDADARQAVADILLQRAQERGVPTMSRKHRAPARAKGVEPSSGNQAL